jgi:hypothetical protein
MAVISGFPTGKQYNKVNNSIIEIVMGTDCLIFFQYFSPVVPGLTDCLLQGFSDINAAIVFLSSRTNCGTVIVGYVRARTHNVS